MRARVASALKYAFAGATLAANAFLWLMPHDVPSAGMFNAEAKLDVSQVQDDRAATGVSWNARMAAATGYANAKHVQFMTTHH